MHNVRKDHIFDFDAVRHHVFSTKAIQATRAHRECWHPGSGSKLVEHRELRHTWELAARAGLRCDPPYRGQDDATVSHFALKLLF
jgi:hypothetical protein